jgi:hypothetical protein
VSVGSRVPNLELQAARHALALSQGEFACAVRRAGADSGIPNNCSKRLVQKWESGDHAICQQHYRRALMHVTGVPFEQLGFVSSFAVRRATPIFAPEFGTPDEAGGATGPGPSDRLRYALERPARADPDSVAIAETIIAQLFERERYQPARLLAAAVDAHLLDLAALLHGTGAGAGPLRRQLAATASAGAGLAGWLAHEQGRETRAFSYWDSAQCASQAAAHPPATAGTLLFMSYAAEEREEVGTAWHLAHTATAHAGRDPRARAGTAARSAELAAALGERAAALAALESAMSLAGSLASAASIDKHTPPWARSVGQCTLATAAMVVYTHLGDLQAARDAAGTALRGLGAERTKPAAVALAQAACVAARTGNLGVAVKAGTRSLDLAEALESTLARRALRALVPLLTPHRADASVGRLLDRLTCDGAGRWVVRGAAGEASGTIPVRTPRMRARGLMEGSGPDSPAQSEKRSVSRRPDGGGDGAAIAVRGRPGR